MQGVYLAETIFQQRFGQWIKLAIGFHSFFTKATEILFHRHNFIQICEYSLEVIGRANMGLDDCNDVIPHFHFGLIPGTIKFELRSKAMVLNFKVWCIMFHIFLLYVRA